jgi:hypothetical protein
MTEKEFLNGLAKGKVDIVQTLLDILTGQNIAYCVIGGLAVNAYVEPVVSLDLDIIITANDLDTFKKAVIKTFEMKTFPHSLNLYHPDSNLRVQVQTDKRYQKFILKAKEKKILGYLMMVASLEDVLQGKIWAYSDPERRQSKRQKDLADILRLIESFPELAALLPDDIRNML